MTYSPLTFAALAEYIRSPRGIIFDLDGTLVDNESLQMSLVQETARVVGYRVSVEEYLSRFMGLSDEEMFAQIITSSRRTRAASELVMIKQEKYLAHLAAGDIQLTAGAMEFVMNLDGCGARVAVATNSSRFETQLTLRYLGLDSLIRTTVTIESVSKGKPAPDAYLRAARLLGLTPGQCLAYEDSTRGIQAATAAGIRVIGIDRSGSDRLLMAGAELVIEDFVGHEIPGSAPFAEDLMQAV